LVVVVAGAVDRETPQAGVSGVAEPAQALSRTAFGATLAAQGVVRHDIAESRITIEQLRLLVHKTAWLLDTVGHKGARIEVAAIKAAVPRAAAEIIDRAIQVHGGLGPAPAGLNTQGGSWRYRARATVMPEPAASITVLRASPSRPDLMPACRAAMGPVV
jgi:acyl-CoA dehydrogenase